MKSFCKLTNEWKSRLLKILQLSRVIGVANYVINATQMKTISFLLLTILTSVGYGQKSGTGSGSIDVESKSYLGSKLIIQGGIISESDRYNDFVYTDTVSTFMKSAKFLTGSSEEYKIGIIASYPHPFQISYFDTSTQSGTSSHYFFVGNNKVSIKLGDLFKEKDVLSGRISKENREYLKLQNQYKKFVNNQTGEIYNLAGKLEVLKQYISRNPNSIVALWDLALNYYLVRSEVDKRKVLAIIQNFSNEVKETKTYQGLTNVIGQDLELAEGTRIPNIFLKGNDSLLSIVSKNKYTLIDYWFLGCSPCIAQFPHYKEIYDSNKVNGFEMIGISVDSRKDEANWQNLIAKSKLNWLQYLDPGGKESEKLYIRKFPTNFLLDNRGLIIKKDISLEDLALFLKNNLN